MWFRICSLLAVFLFAGCGGNDGPKMAKVSGIITYKSQPVSDVDVTFIGPNASRSSFGRTNAQGEFQLTTVDANDGAVVGENLITVAQSPASSGEATMRVSGTPDPEMAKKLITDVRTTMEAAKKKQSPKDTRIPKKYASIKESGLKRSVVQGEKNYFKIDLSD